MYIFSGSPLRGLFLSSFIWAGLVFFQTGNVWSEGDAGTSTDSAAETSVYAVYGVNDSADFLPDETTPVRRHTVVKRKKQLRSPLEMPDGFYVIGIPVFSILFLIVLVEMLKEMPDTTDTR